jgi:hypothetical protein
MRNLHNKEWIFRIGEFLVARFVEQKQGEIFDWALERSLPKDIRHNELDGVLPGPQALRFNRLFEDRVWTVFSSSYRNCSIRK